VEGKKMEVEVADTPCQEPLRQRYLEAKSLDTVYLDPIKKFYLFVGGLKVPMTKLELRSVFEPYGEPTVTEMSAPYRGYVFVELRTTEARAVQVGQLRNGLFIHSQNF